MSSAVVDFATCSLLLFVVIGIWISPKGTLRNFFVITPELNQKKIWIIAFVLLISIKTLATILLPEIETPETEKMVQLFKRINFSSVAGYLLILFGGLFVPLLEETFCRGWALQPFYRSKKTLIIGSILVSILFGMAHAHPYDKVFSGLIYSYLRIKQKTLIGTITIHTLVNLSAVLIAGFVNSI